MLTKIILAKTFKKLRTFFTKIDAVEYKKTISEIIALIKQDCNNESIGSISLLTMTMIKIYGLSVVFVDEIRIYGKY